MAGVTPIGEITLGAALPQVSVAFGNELLNVQAQVAALLAFSVTPPSLETDLQLAAENTLDLTLAASLGITPPSIDQQLLEVQAQIAILLGQLGLLLVLSQTLAVSAHVYAWDGQVGSFGTDFATELVTGLPGGGPTDVGFAVVLIATAPDAVAALQSLFKVTP